MNHSTATRERLSNLDAHEIQQLWEEFYTFFRDAPNTYPVDRWRYGELDIWPILKGLILLRAVRIFHNGQFDLLYPDDTPPLSKVVSVQKVRDVTAQETKLQSIYWKRKLVTRKRELVARARPSYWKHRLTGGQKGFLDILNAQADALLNVRSKVAAELPLKPADVLMFNTSVSSTITGRYIVQQHLDPLRVLLGEHKLSSTCFILDHAEDVPFQAPHLVPGVYGFSKSFARLQTGAAPNFQLICSKLPGFDDFWKDAAAFLPLQCLIEPQQLQSVYSRTYSTKRLLYQYIKNTKAKAVVVSAYYGIFGWAASSACKALNIPLIDVQHGVAGPGHESYDFCHLTKTGFNTVPTHFLCWTNYDKKHLDTLSNGSYEALEIGQSWKLVQELLSSEYDYRILSAKRIEEARVATMDKRQALQFKKTSFVASDSEAHSFSVLFALQNDSDLEWATELVSSLPEHFTFYFRLHPATVSKPEILGALVAKYESAQVNIKLASTASLDVLMPYMDCVVTKYSSIVLDALAFGKPSICYGKGAKWYFGMLGSDQPKYCSDSLEGIVEALLNIAQEVDAQIKPKPHMPLLTASVAKLFGTVSNG